MLPWRNTVTEMAYRAMDRREDDLHPLSGPVGLEAIFFMPRPKSRKDEYWHVTTPDLDKLLRAICDALTYAGVVVDDKVIADISTRKVYGERTGVQITVSTLDSAGE